MGEPEQETGGVEVTGARRVDHVADPRRGHLLRLVTGHDDRTVLAPRDGGDGAGVADPLEGGAEIGIGEQRQELGLVGEQHVDLTGLEQLQELGPPVVDAHDVGKAQGRLAPRAVGDAQRLAEGIACTLGVPEPLGVGHVGCGDVVFAYVIGVQFVGGAQVRTHGAVGVGRHEDQAASCRSPIRRNGGLVAHTGRTQVVHEHLAQLVVAHLADVLGRATQRGHADGRVGSRAAGHFDARGHGGVQALRLLGVKKTPDILLEAEVTQLVVGDQRQHVDHGVAKGEDVHVAGVSASSCASGRRVRGRPSWPPPACGVLRSGRPVRR